MKKLFFLMIGIFLSAQINYKFFINGGYFKYNDTFSVSMTAPWGDKVKNSYHRKDTSNLAGGGFLIAIDKTYFITFLGSIGKLNIKENNKNIKINSFYMNEMLFDYVFYKKDYFSYSGGVESVIWNGKKSSYKNTGNAQFITLGIKFFSPSIKGLSIKGKTGIGSVKDEIGSLYYLKTDNKIDFMTKINIGYLFNIKKKNFFVTLNGFHFFRSNYNNYSIKMGIIIK